MSIHTFELSKSFGKGENGYLKYQEFLDRAQTDCQKEGYKIFYDRSNNPGYKCHRLLKFMGLGIQVHLIANHNDYYIKFIVNLQKVLVADGLVKIINESNAQEAIEMVNWQLSSWLGDEFEIDRLRLSRVDICSNIDVGSAELVSAYIRQMYRAGATKSYKVYGKKEYGKRFDKVAGFPADRRWMIIFRWFIMRIRQFRRDCPVYPLMKMFCRILRMRWMAPCVLEVYYQRHFIRRYQEVPESPRYWISC